MSEKLHKRFKSGLTFSNIDHIIIGSGIGGLTAATWLAKAGKKVVVFEKHYVPGGFTHSFKRKNGFKWDVGVHYVGNVGPEGSLRSFFDFLTGSNLEWESMGETYDVVHIDNDYYEIKAGAANFKKQLLTYFPEEEKAIDTYLELIRKSNRMANAFFFEKTFKPILGLTLGKIIKRFFHKYSQRTTLEVLTEITTNKRLIAVLCAQCGNYGLSPKYSSFAAHATVVNHFMEGGYYPTGGAEQIAYKTIETIHSLGGEVYINADVSEIVVEKNRVQGVKINGEFIACKSVISNVGVNNTFNFLLDEKARKKCGYNLEGVQPSTGHICLYLGLDKSDEDLNLPKHNVWYFGNENFDEILDNDKVGETAKQFSYISFPSAKDPEWQKENPGTATIQAIAAGKYDWFLDHEDEAWMKRGEDYNDIKEEFKNIMLQRLYKLFPQIEGHVVVTEVSTPLSSKHFSNYKNGEIYGLEHTPARFKLPFLRPETKIKGLSLVGQDITLVGVGGAMLSGMLVAITILKFKVWQIFKEINSLKEVE